MKKEFHDFEFAILLNNIFKSEYWYLLYFDENGNELNFDGYKRIKFTNPLFNCDFCINHEGLNVKIKDFTKLSLTTKYNLNYIIQQEVNEELTNKNNFSVIINIIFYRNIKNPSFLTKEMNLFFQENPNLINNFILLDSNNNQMSYNKDQSDIENNCCILDKSKTSFLYEINSEIVIKKSDYFKIIKKEKNNEPK